MSEREPLEGRLTPVYDEAQIAATWRRIAEVRALRSQPRPRGRMALAGGIVAVAVLGALVVLARPEAARVVPLTSVDPTVLVAPGAIWTSERPVVLDDHSTIALAPGGRLQVLVNEGDRFSTLLAAGSAHFDVRPGGPRRWEVETALATVEVVGTAFTVMVSAGQLEVFVERGVVTLRGERVPGRVVRLTTGERTVVGSDVAAVPVFDPMPPMPPMPPTPTPTPMPPMPIPPRPRNQTHASAPAVPASAMPAAARSIANTLAEADRLSSTGDPEGAASLLQQLHATNGPSAGLVSFTLGRLYLDALGRPELAAVAFEEVIAHGSPQSLIEDAYARRVEALLRAGLRDRAAAALAEYERAYPRGRRLGALRARLASP